MSRASEKREADERARRRCIEAEAIERGDVFRVDWSTGYGGGQAYHRTREKAEAHRDEIVSKHAIEIPLDYYERQASLTKLEVSIAAFEAGKWSAMADSARTCAMAIKYHDEPKAGGKRRR